MSNEEIICGWMEARPTKRWCDEQGYSLFDPACPPCPWKWWSWNGLANIWGGTAQPVVLTLDRLHEVEARLTDEQRGQYSKMLSSAICANGPSAFYRTELFVFFNASAEQKISALASVLKGGAA